MESERPHVTITYCVKCHFLPRAAWVAQELLHTFAEHLAGVTLEPGGGGRFDIRLDGELVYSTSEAGRFPEMRELRRLVATRLEEPPVLRHDRPAE